MSLLTYRQYCEALRTLSCQYPWVGQAVIRPAPGHLLAASEYLRELQEICGADYLQANLQHLRLVSDEDGQRLVIHADCVTPPKLSALDDSMKLARATAITASRRSCTTCGDSIKGGYSVYFCGEHEAASTAFLFADPNALPASAPSLQAASVDAILATDTLAPLRRVHVLPSFDDTIECDLPECVPLESLVILPHLQVFDPAMIKVVRDSASGNTSSDHQDRAKKLATRLEKTEALKPLAQFPADMERMFAELKEDFPNFSEFLDFIEEQGALSSFEQSVFALPPILLNGEPGIGKTELASRLATLVDTQCMAIEMATAQSGSHLSGSDEFWNNTQPGQLFDTLVFGRTGNPIVLLDELDKASGDLRFDPTAGLHGLLEHRTAKAFRDLSVPALPVDASKVVWIGLCNYVERISAPIRSRFRVFDIPTPDEAQTRHIAQTIYADLLVKFNGRGQLDPALPEDVLDQLGATPPRGLRTVLMSAMGKAAKTKRSTITPDDIDPLDPRPTRRRIGFQ